ncbi:uncharacterized protein LOC143026431 isoform X2 [Oratosquilla oratoria]
MLLMVSLLFLPTIITPSTEEQMKQENNLHELNTIALDNILSKQSKEFAKAILKNHTLLTALGTPDLDLITKNRKKVLEKLEEELKKDEIFRGHATRGDTTSADDDDDDDDEDHEDTLMRLLSNVLAIRAQDQLEELEELEEHISRQATSGEVPSREVLGPSDSSPRGRGPSLNVGRVPLRGATAPGAPSPVPPPSSGTPFFPSATRVPSNTVDTRFGTGPPPPPPLPPPPGHVMGLSPVHATGPSSVGRTPQVNPAHTEEDIQRKVSIDHIVFEGGPSPAVPKDRPSGPRVLHAHPGVFAEDVSRSRTTHVVPNSNQRFNPGRIGPQGSATRPSSTGTARFDVRGGTRTGVPLPGVPPSSRGHLPVPGSPPFVGRESPPRFRGGVPSAVPPSGVAIATSSETPSSGSAVPSFPTPSSLPSEPLFPFHSSATTPSPSHPRPLPPTPFPSRPPHTTPTSFPSRPPPPPPTPFPSHLPDNIPFPSNVPSPRHFPSDAPTPHPFPSRFPTPTSFPSHPPSHIPSPSDAPTTTPFPSRSPDPTPFPSNTLTPAPFPSSPPSNAFTPTPFPSRFPIPSSRPDPSQDHFPSPVPPPAFGPFIPPSPTPFPSPPPSQAPNPSLDSAPSHFPTPSPGESTPSPVPGVTPVPAPDSVLSSSSSSFPRHPLPPASVPSPTSPDEHFSSTTPSVPTPVSSPSTSPSLTSPDPSPALSPGLVPGSFFPDVPGPGSAREPIPVPSRPSAVPELPEGSGPEGRQNSSSAGVNIGAQDPAFEEVSVKSIGSLSEGAGRGSSGGFGPGETSRGFGPGVTSRDFGPGETSRGFGPGDASRGFGHVETSRGFGPGDISRGFGQGETSRGFGPGDAPRGFSPGDTPRGFGPGDASGGFGPGDTPRDFGPGDAPRGFGSGDTTRGFGPVDTTRGFGPGDTSGDLRQPHFVPGGSPTGNTQVAEDRVIARVGDAAGTTLSNVFDTRLTNGTLPPSSDSASLLLILSNAAAARALDRLSGLNDVTSLTGSDLTKSGVPEGQGSPSFNPPPSSPPSIGQTESASGVVVPSERRPDRQQSGAAIGESVITPKEGSREPGFGQVAGAAETPGVQRPLSGSGSSVPVDTGSFSSTSLTKTATDFSPNLPVSSSSGASTTSGGVVGVSALPPAPVTTQTPGGVPGISTGGLPSTSGQSLSFPVSNTPPISINNSFPPFGSTLNASTPISSFVFHVANPSLQRIGSSTTGTGPQGSQRTGNAGSSRVGAVSVDTVFPAGVLPRNSPTDFHSASPTSGSFPTDPPRTSATFVNPFPFPPGPVTPSQLGIKTVSPRSRNFIGGTSAGPTPFVTRPPVVDGSVKPTNFSQLFRSVAQVGVLKAQQAAANSVLGTTSTTPSTSTPVHSHFQITIPGHSHFHVHASPSPSPPTSPASSTRNPFLTHPQKQTVPTTLPTSSSPPQTIHPHFTIPTHSTRRSVRRSSFPTFPPSRTSQSGASRGKQLLDRNVPLETSSLPSQRPDTSPSPSPLSSRSPNTPSSTPGATSPTVA